MTPIPPAPSTEPPAPQLPTALPASVPIAQLHQRLGWAQAYVDPRGTPPAKALTDWTMNEDDDPILRYLFRQHQPRRHLEFGTWQGDGVVRVLEECAATVWTINLYEGESNVEGQWAYYVSRPPEKEVVPGSSTRTSPKGNLLLQTDSRAQIGRRYLEAGLGRRVCQIFADSTQWDTAQYPPGFFDSVLIDGGHRREICLADTAKAIPLLRRGGLCLWHDYCPIPGVMAQCPSVPGVVAAIGELMTSPARQAFSDLFWIEPSWLLVGVKR